MVRGNTLTFKDWDEFVTFNKKTDEALMAVLPEEFRMTKVLICYAAKFDNGVTLLNHQFVTLASFSESDIKFELGLLAALEQKEYADKVGANMGAPDMAILNIIRLDG